MVNLCADVKSLKEVQGDSVAVDCTGIQSLDVHCFRSAHKIISGIASC